MADITEAIRRLIFEYVSEGADKVMQTQEAVAASTTQTDKASLSLEKSFGNLERRYVATVRSQQDYAKVQQQVNAAVAQNPTLQERANVVLAAAGQHFDNLAVRAEKGGIAAAFLSKALTTIIGPAGLIGVALTAATAAIAYIVEKFQLIPQVLDLIRAGLATLGWEQAAQAVGNYADRMKEVHAAAEKQKAAIKEIQDIHPTISKEVAEQVQLQEAQLKAAQARTPEEKLIADQLVLQVQLQQQGKTLAEQAVLLAGQRAIAEAKIYDIQERENEANRRATEERGQAVGFYTDQITSRTEATKKEGYAEADARQSRRKSNEEAVKAEQERTAALNAQDAAQARASRALREAAEAAANLNSYMKSVAFWATTFADVIEDAMDMVPTQFGDETFESTWDPLMMGQRKATYENLYGGYKTVKAGTGLGQYELVLPDFDAIRTNLSDLVDTNEAALKSTDSLTASTDALNATMQGALSPYYSQDPRTTKLGFRAGVTGNPDWMTGATNANPLVAVLGAGATAPGMAAGGSFTVGGGYSANDNRMAVFPVASGEEVVVNRNPQGRSGQSVNIDNRIIINGTIDDDALSKMKVSRYQQAQRMRAGMAGA